MTYFGSNLLRIPHGSWFPIAVGTGFFTVMATWRRSADLLARKADKSTGDMGETIEQLPQKWGRPLPRLC